MINMEKILPELMDWKAVEKASEDGIRQAEIAIALHNLARATAKIQIKKLKGKTSEEENDQFKKLENKKMPNM